MSRPLPSVLALPGSLLLCWTCAGLAWSNPALWLLLPAAASVLAGIVFLASVQPPSQIYGAAVNRGRRDAVALTFDDGPDPEHTPAVLDTLDAAGARATFFLIGRKVRQHPEVARAIVQRGHQVALHGHEHTWWIIFVRSWCRRDVQAAVAAVRDATGRVPAWFRPPIGLLTPELIDAAAEAGARVAGWSLRPRDGVIDDPAVVERRVAEGLRGGDVVLLHDATRPDGRPPPARAALPGILAAIEERGLKAVTLAELCDAPAYVDEAPPSRQLPWPRLVPPTLLGMIVLTAALA